MLKTHVIKKSKLLGISLLGFLFTIQYSLPIYINSSFLASLTTEWFFGFIYPLASILSILLFINAPHLLQKFGNYRIGIAMFLINMATLLVMAFSNTSSVIIAAFIVNFASVAFTYLTFDVIIEHSSLNASTGTVRGLFFTGLNIAWLFGPLLGAFVLAHGDYWHVYTLSALMMIPFIFLFRIHSKEFTDPPYIKSSLWKTFRKISKDRNVYKIFMAKFLLHFFFALMVIYMPIYLSSHIGLSWETIGIIFAIILLPFALLEAPLGRLADTLWGEKEILSVGFIITALSTILISFTVTTSAIIWTLVLFATRIGASMIEIMTETYLFKKISDVNINIMSLFRTMRPWAYISCPLVVTLLLTMIDLRYVFGVIGILLLYGLRYSLTLKDTR
ncbi:hypothetical protein COB55_01025 [Candidatus Wolfebacteria bacterium]|nr:MAG: hypothetical protein COB55_01025 [Candidatus Wolfebacteria bacterium]